MKTIFYVDGFNFYYSAVKGTPLRWLNFESLFQRVFPNNSITAIKYFTTEVDGDIGNSGAMFATAGLLACIKEPTES